MKANLFIVSKVADGLESSSFVALIIGRNDDVAKRSLIRMSVPLNTKRVSSRQSASLCRCSVLKIEYNIRVCWGTNLEFDGDVCPNKGWPMLEWCVDWVKKYNMLASFWFIDSVRRHISRGHWEAPVGPAFGAQTGSSFHISRIASEVGNVSAVTWAFIFPTKERRFLGNTVFFRSWLLTRIIC